MHEAGTTFVSSHQGSRRDSRLGLGPRRRLIAAAGVVSLVLAACSGGGSSSSPAGGAASTPPSAAATTGASTGTSPSAATTSEKVTIMVGGLSKFIYLPAKLTEQLGYFQEQGLNVELVDEGAGQDATEAVVAGQVQGAVGFYDHTVDIAGLGKHLIDVIQLDAPLGEVEIVATSQADKIKSFADLKSQNIGVTGKGSSTDLLSHFLAVKAGLQASDVNTVPVGAGDTFIAAMQKGQIVAGMTTEPTVSRVLKTGLGKVLVDMRTVEGATAALGGNYPGASLYMQKAYVDAHKDIVQKLVNAFVKTLKWIHSHSAAEIAAKMPTDYSSADPELYQTALEASLPMFTADGHMPQGAPELVLQVLQTFDENVKGKTIDLSQTYTNEFVDAAPG
jgi:NitT/TauT family transport system substrate-binding protein